MTFYLYRFKKKIGEIYFDEMDCGLLKALCSQGIRAEVVLTATEIKTEEGPHEEARQV